jgi:alpha-L-fucosidase
MLFFATTFFAQKPTNSFYIDPINGNDAAAGTSKSQAFRSITQAPVEFKVPENSILTYNPKTKRLYIHLLEYPLQNFNLPDYKGKVKYAQFLHDGSEIKITAKEGHWIKEEENPNDLNLSLPVVKPNVEIPVIELILN